MSEIWNFSPSVEHLVQHCIVAASQEQDNKWTKEFGHLKTRLLTLQNSASAVTETLIDLCDSEETGKHAVLEENMEVSEDVQDQEQNVLDELHVKNIDELVEALETEFHSNFEAVVRDCVENHELLSLLAKQLSSQTLSKLCTQVYEQKEINKVFLYKFFEYFLPAYIKREYNSNTLDILIRGSKTYPFEFRMLIKMLFKDQDIPAKVLQDYILTLNEEQSSNFIMSLSEFDLSGEEFVNNLFSIYTAYKNCLKTEKIQDNILSILSQYSLFCVTDRNYGRLFLTYLQSQKTVKTPANYNHVEKLLEQHRSPFKRPCLMMVKELTSCDDEMATDDDDSE